MGESSGNAVQPPFFSFSDVDYQDVLLPAKGVALVEDQTSPLQRLVIKNKPYLTIKQGKTWKAPYYCSQIVRSVFLSVDRFFLPRPSSHRKRRRSEDEIMKEIDEFVSKLVSLCAEYGAVIFPRTDGKRHILSIEVGGIRLDFKRVGAISAEKVVTE